MIQSRANVGMPEANLEGDRAPIVIFDIDGTLTHCHDADFELFFSTIRDVLKLPEISQDLSGYVDITDAGIVHEIVAKHFGRSATQAELERLEDEFASRLACAAGHSIHSQEMKGAKPFVEHLESLGIDIGIATGNWRKSTAIKLGAIGLDRLATKAGTSTDARARKEILHLAAQKHSASVSRPKWYIGDGVWDVECSRSLGFNFIGIGPKLKSADLPLWAEDFQAADKFLKAILADYKYGNGE